MDNYKEYLDPADGYALVKQSVNMPVHPHWIGVPDGAELYVYWRENDTYNFQVDKSYFENGSWQPCAWTVEEIKSEKAGAKILWSRKPKEDPALISGRDAWLANFDGIEVEYRRSTNEKSNWYNFAKEEWTNEELKTGPYEFRLKPQTIKLELELPKPFEPKVGEEVFYINDTNKTGFCVDEHQAHYNYNFGVWRTEEEIKQVVEQLRKIRGTNS